MLFVGLFRWLNLVELDYIVDDVQEDAVSAARARSSGLWYPSQTLLTLHVHRETVSESV